MAESTVLLRQVLGAQLRHHRTEQSRTLRDVSRKAQISLAYLSEIERGQKEASSELLAAICAALDVQLAALLRGASYTLDQSRQTPVELVSPVAQLNAADSADAAVLPPAQAA